MPLHEWWPLTMSHLLLRRLREIAPQLHHVPPGPRFVLWVYCESANEKHNLEAWPSVSLLVMLTGLAERSVQRYIQDLVKLGLLVVVDRGGGRLSARYRVNLDAATPAATAIPAEAQAGLAELGLMDPPTD